MSITEFILPSSWSGYFNPQLEERVVTSRALRLHLSEGAVAYLEY